MVISSNYRIAAGKMLFWKSIYHNITFTYYKQFL